MNKKLIWYFMGFAAAVGLIILSVGFYDALRASGGSDSTAEVKTLIARKKSDSVSVTLIGDSLARGTGDEEGDGFSTYLPAYLKGMTSKNVLIHNAGINELKSDELLENLKNGQLDSQIANSDLIVVSIGGNDILTLQHVDDSKKYSAFMDKKGKYINNLQEILDIIRNNSQDAFVVFVGLYNPREDAFSHLNSLVLSVWNNSTRKIIEEDNKAIFITTDDIFKSDLKRYIADDTLHPNSLGYQAISNKIVSTLNLD